MEKIEESIKSVEMNTLQGTKESLKHLYEIATGVKGEEIAQLLERCKEGEKGNSARYLLSLFLSSTLIAEGKYKEALDLAEHSIKQMEGEDTRALDGIIAGMWAALRVAANRLNIDVLPLYFQGLAASREFKNTESATVLVNNILIHLTNKKMYAEAYTFLTNTSLPENADVEQSSVFHYLSAKIYLVSGEYALAEKMTNLAIVKSTDKLFSGECKKLYVLAALHQGVHPEKEFFRRNPGLLAYQKILLAIRSCSLSTFHQVTQKYREAFESDGVWEVVARLGPAVQKEHVRRIGIIYSRIRLEEVGKMLGVSVESAVFLLQKAIADGTISGYIDKQACAYISSAEGKEEGDVPNLEEMLALANHLVMLKKHEPIQKKSIEEMKADMSYSEYQM